MVDPKLLTETVEGDASSSKGEEVNEEEALYFESDFGAPTDFESSITSRFENTVNVPKDVAGVTREHADVFKSVIETQTEQHVEMEKLEVYKLLEQANMKMRRQYATRLFWLFAAALFLLFTLVFGIAAKVLELPETVLIALIIAITTKVLALVWLVVRYLFDASGVDKEMAKLIGGPLHRQK